MSLLDEALKYRKLGWAVLPMVPGIRKKLPFIKWKEFQNRLPTEDEIKAWWDEHPNANIGIVTGPVSGVVVFDADSEKAHQFIKSKGGMPPTPQSHSGREHGTHFFLKYPGEFVKTNSNPELKLDIRGDKGLVVLPPSIHHTGKRYEWVQFLNPWDADVEPLRPWMLEYIRSRNGDGPSPLRDSKSEEINRIMQCVFLKHCDEDRDTLSEPEWYCMVSNLARARGGPAKVHELSQGYPGYSPKETDAKILHALNDTGPHTCKSIKSLWPCGKNCKVGSPAALARVIYGPEEVMPKWDPLTLADTTILTFLEEDPPEREYYFEDRVPRNIVGNISARGGASKSFLVISLCMGLATAKQVLGHFIPTRPANVLALFAEDSQPELHRRIHFTSETLFPDMDKATRALLVENFHAKSVDGMVGGLMELRDGNPMLAPKYQWLCETIEAHDGLELLFLDPKSRFYGLDENNNDHNTMWLICLENLRKQYGVDVIFTHHVSQSQGDRLVQTAARGGTALIDGVRWAANLRVLTEKDAKRFDLEDYHRYVEFDVTKSNYSPMLPRSLYFKREAEGVLVPVDLRHDRLKRIADELTRLCSEAYLSAGVMFTKRELTQRKKGAELRQTIKETIPSCTAKDIAQAIDYTLKEGMAELVPDPEELQRKLIKVVEVTG